MEEQLWSKTLLKSYSYLERIGNSIDRTVCGLALGSRVTYTMDNTVNSTYTIMEKLIELNERKILLVNTKVLVDKILKSMNKDSAKFLVLKYIKGYTTDKVASLTHTPIRTTSRKLNLALTQFGKILLSLGYTPSKLTEMYSSEYWIKTIYQKVESDFKFYTARSAKPLKVLKFVTNGTL